MIYYHKKVEIMENKKKFLIILIAFFSFITLTMSIIFLFIKKDIKKHNKGNNNITINEKNENRENKTKNTNENNKEVKEETPKEEENKTTSSEQREIKEENQVKETNKKTKEITNKIGRAHV